MTPIDRVRAKPLTIVAPKALPNQNRIPQVIKVAILESRIEGQALFQAISTAWFKRRPSLNYSFNRSKIKILASSALPVLNMIPAIPGNVKVTGTYLKIEKVIIA